MEVLSELELKVLRLSSQGNDQQSIATELGISVRSVARHASNACRKLEVDKQPGAIAVAIAKGMIPKPEEHSSKLSLTPQEKEVGKGVVEGLTNLKIAGKIDKPLSTVRKTVETLLRKMGCSNRRELASALAASGLLS